MVRDEAIKLEVNASHTLGGVGKGIPKERAVKRTQKYPVMTSPMPGISFAISYARHLL